MTRLKGVNVELLLRGPTNLFEEIMDKLLTTYHLGTDIKGSVSYYLRSGLLLLVVVRFRISLSYIMNPSSLVHRLIGQQNRDCKSPICIFAFFGSVILMPDLGVGECEIRACNRSEFI